jgi:hypothetical protein
MTLADCVKAVGEGLALLFGRQLGQPVESPVLSRHQ